jgi:hypothetical protein
MTWGSSGGPSNALNVSGEGRGPASREPEKVACHSFSFLKGRPFDDPKDVKDGFNQAAADELRGCAAILGDCKCSTTDVERLMIEAMEVRFTLKKVEGEATRFPFDTELPLGIFLDVKINPKALSPYALIETLFRSLARRHDDGSEGVVKAFEELLATRLVEFEKAQEDDEGQSAAGGAQERASRRKSKETAAPPAEASAPLPVRIGAFLGCIGGALNMIWSEGVKAKLGGCQIGPCPLLEQRCSLNTVGDLLITLAPDSPEIPRSAWGFTTACTAAEAALKKLGFARESFDSVKGESLNLKTRKVAVWVEHGGNVPQNKRHSPGGANTSAPRAQTTASTWSFGGGAGNAEMRVGGGAPAPAPAPSPRFQQPSGDPTAWCSGVVPPVPATGGAFAGFGSRPGPSKPATDEERRIETARQGDQAGAGMQDRNAVMSSFKPYSMTEGVEAMSTFLGRRAEQQRLGMGFAADGSGGLNLDTAPDYLKRALYRGDGDKVIKLDPQAGLLIAPGVSGEVRVLVQVQMRGIGVEMSYGMVDNVVQLAYHQVPISGMQSKGSSQCRMSYRGVYCED